jgi:DNA-directed RNA polymerase subunit RPC12/RpoP
MGRWALICKQCSEEFTHSQVKETLANFFIPEPPKFPPEGLERECPKCHAKSIYQQRELRYRKV